MKLDYQWTGPDDFFCWGPYISFGNDASHEVRITWRSKFMTMEKWIQYGESEQCEHKIHENTLPSYLQSFTLTGLKPDTLYYFRISRPENHIKDKEDIYNAGILIPEFIEKDGKPLYSFRTAPNITNQSNNNHQKMVFEFCVTSDIHCEGTNIQNLLQQMDHYASDNRFLIVTGDITSHGGQEAAWNSYFYQLHPYIIANSKKGKNFALLNIPGNHDSDHPETYAHFIHTFNHPYEDIRTGGYYYTIYGNSVFIMLDSCNAGQTKATQGLVSDDQIEWLESTLERFAKKNYWIFVCLHHEIYSTGYKNGMIKLYETIYLDLFNEYHVDAVFYGHDHQFEVYWQSKDHNWGGTHYFLIGNGGTGLTNLEEMKERGTQANYIWPQKTYLFERDGILKGNPNGARNDEVIENAFQYGLIEESGFLHMKITGDLCEVKMIGANDGTLFYHDTFERTGMGKSYHKPLFVKKDVP
jgi:predicted phosphodiesterase